MEEQENKMLGKLYIYRSQMAPHNRKRQGGKLLLEAIEEIERLIDANAKLREVMMTTEAVRLQETRRAIKAEEQIADLREHADYWSERAETEKNARQEVHEAQKYWEERAQKAEITLSAVYSSLRYAFENLPYPDTLTGNREYDIARIALGIQLDKCKPIKEEHE